MSGTSIFTELITMNNYLEYSGKMETKQPSHPTRWNQIRLGTIKNKTSATMDEFVQVNPIKNKEQSPTHFQSNPVYRSTAINYHCNRR